MRKEGVSNVLVISLLILVVIIAIVLVYVIIKGNILSSGEKNQESLTCLQDVDLKIISSCYEGNQIQIKVKNNNAFDYNAEFFILRIVRNGESVEIPTQWQSTLAGLETKTFISYADNPEEIEEGLFIPRIEKGKGFYCYGRALEFTLEQC